MAYQYHNMYYILLVINSKGLMQMDTFHIYMT